MDSALIDQLSTLVIIVSADTYQVKLINQSARQLVGSLSYIKASNVENLTFAELFPSVKLGRLLKRLNKGKNSEFIIEFEINQTQVPIVFKLKALTDGSLMLEGSDYSAVRETEHMLKSYSELIEKKNRQYKLEQRRVERLLFNILPEN